MSKSPVTPLTLMSASWSRSRTTASHARHANPLGALFGDFSGFKIVDHLGSNVEFVPFVMGLTRGFPLGERGLYYHWRTGSGVVKPNALRYLEVK
jgi:predicted phage gp36 major capsid-like protein